MAKRKKKLKTKYGVYADLASVEGTSIADLRKAFDLAPEVWIPVRLPWGEWEKFLKKRKVK